ncbi:hypothetical protein CDEST_04998 [Colletotrichum destructivum]|uniref:Uncharacterized protein n=1 Tax=Colletotrichum destructivum TaxID=34406 RepID=A0AAX4I9L3_9PEZI|nr:hypothetical protein CDEST_04998 [Colletotrichum destructivum]
MTGRPAPQYCNLTSLGAYTFPIVLDGISAAQSHNTTRHPLRRQVEELGHMARLPHAIGWQPGVVN